MTTRKTLTLVLRERKISTKDAVYKFAIFLNIFLPSFYIKITYYTGSKVLS